MADSYIETFLPAFVVEKLEAGAFRSLCSHLKERSDEVQNIDLMSVSGFCRNCLAKWMVVEARTLSQDLKDDVGKTQEDLNQILQALNALGYDEAAQYVYGCDYGEWKTRHAKKASDEQMQKYNESMPFHSVFDTEILAIKGEKPTRRLKTATISSPVIVDSKSLNSNVCCQDVDESTIEASKCEIPKLGDSKKSRVVSAFVPPQPPTGGIDFSIAIITISDRAFTDQYESGDLSGPAVERAVNEIVHGMNSMGASVSCRFKESAIVPDEVEQIQSKLKDCANLGVDLILTTGGTGFSPRDVTPEATMAVVDRECRGLMPFVTSECSKEQPLAALSRGIAGVLGSTMICNLPGNPKGIEEIINVLLPIVLHGICQSAQ